MKPGITRRELEITDRQEILRILDQCKIIHVGIEESNVFQEHMPCCLPRELLPPSHLYIFVFVPEWLSGLLQATYVAEKSLYRRDCHIVPV